MAKKITAVIKLQVPAAKATPAPPIGPALGQAGVNIPGFCKDFNARTAHQEGGTVLHQEGQQSCGVGIEGAVRQQPGQCPGGDGMLPYGHGVAVGAQGIADHGGPGIVGTHIGLEDGV